MKFFDRFKVTLKKGKIISDSEEYRITNRKKVVLPADIWSENYENFVRVMDLSATGCCIRSIKPFDMNSIVLLKLKIPENGRYKDCKPINNSLIKWLQESKTIDGFYLMGVQFKEPATEEHGVISNLK